MAGHTEVKKFMKELKRQGLNFTLSNGGRHYRLLDQDGKLICVIGKTPSDFRWKVNTILKIKRSGYEFRDPKERRAEARRQRQSAPLPKEEAVSTATAVSTYDRLQAFIERVRRLNKRDRGVPTAVARVFHTVGVSSSTSGAAAVVRQYVRGRADTEYMIRAALDQAEPFSDAELRKRMKQTGPKSHYLRQQVNHLLELMEVPHRKTVPWRRIQSEARIQAATEGVEMGDELTPMQLSNGFRTAVESGHSKYVEPIEQIIALATRRMNGVQADRAEVPATAEPEPGATDEDLYIEPLPTTAVPVIERTMPLHLIVLEQLLPENEKYILDAVVNIWRNEG